MKSDVWSAHPNASILGCYVDGSLTPEERSELEAHLSRCADCRLVARETVHTLARRRRRRHTLSGLGVVTAAAAVVAALAIFPAQETDTGPPLTRGPESSERVAATIPVFSPERSVSPDTRVDFVWGSMGADVRYRLSLSTPEGEEIWGVSSPDTVATLPTDVELTAGRSYVWFVDALLADGGSATTGLRRLTVR